jgi:hypothetical protein
MQVKRFTEDQLQRLQDAENAADKAWRAAYEKHHTELPHWTAAGVALMADFNLTLPKFWPKNFDNSDKIREKAIFLKHIFPLWRPIWDRLDAAHNCNRSDKDYVSELDTVHLIDWKVLRDAFEFPPKQSSAGLLGRLGKNAAIKPKPETTPYSDD